MLVSIYPERGLQERKDAEVKEYLASVKAKMTPEEIEAIVEQTKRPVSYTHLDVYKRQVLDEPTTYLDINHQLEIMELLKRLNKEQDLTVLMVLHELTQACLLYTSLLTKQRWASLLRP